MRIPPDPDEPYYQPRETRERSELNSDDRHDLEREADELLMQRVAEWNRQMDEMEKKLFGSKPTE